MRALQKLSRHGSSHGFTIPGAMLRVLRWLPSETFLVEVVDAESVRIRRPRQSDFEPLTAPTMLPRTADTDRP